MIKSHATGLAVPTRHSAGFDQMINNSGTQWQLREAGGQRPAFVDLWTASVRKVVNLMEVEDHAGFRDLR